MKRGVRRFQPYPDDYRGNGRETRKAAKIARKMDTLEELNDVFSKASKDQIFEAMKAYYDYIIDRWGSVKMPDNGSQSSKEYIQVHFADLLDRIRKLDVIPSKGW